MQVVLSRDFEGVWILMYYSRPEKLQLKQSPLTPEAAVISPIPRKTGVHAKISKFKLP